MFGFLLVLACVGPENGLDALPGGEGGTGPEGVRGVPGREVSERTDGPAAVEEPGLPPEEDDPDAEALYAPGVVHEFHLSIPAEGRAALALAPKEPVPGTFRAKGHIYDVTIRLKGTTTFRPLSGKAAFKVNFDDIDPEGRFHGRKRLTLNSMLQDSSMLHEHVAYWFFRSRGLPAPRHSFAQVYVDGEYYGLYGVVETMDEQWLKRAFPGDDDGNLFEANLADFTPGSAEKFEVEESADLATPTENMAALIDALAAAPANGFLAALEAHFDLDALMDTLAIDLVSGNVDGYTRLRNNYMVYEATNAGRWYITPWGYDQSMQWHQGLLPYESLSGHLGQRCGQDPACAARLTAAVEDVLADWESGDLAAYTSDATGLVSRLCREDPRAEFACDAEHVLPFVLSRPESVREELEEETSDD